MRVIYCGFGKPGANGLIQLLSMDGIEEDNILVFTHDISSNSEMLNLLTRLGVNYVCTNINKCSNIVKSFNPDYMVSIYYRYVIKDEILSLCDYKAVNCHSSLLPKYKGKYAPFWIIYNGEEYAGITYHMMINPVDSGNILLQDKIKLSKKETAYSLYHKISNLCTTNFKKGFQMLLDGKVGYRMEKIPDSEKTFEYYKSEFPFDGKMSYENDIDELFRFSKAVYHPNFKGAIIYNKNIEIEVVGIPTIDKIVSIKEKLKNNY